MIVTKVKPNSKKDKVNARQPSAVAESTTAGIRVSPDDIRERAFQIYQNRGGQDGCAIEDWLDAERQIAQR